MNRGYLIVAQNTPGVDYIKCARLLCKSIKKAMPDEKVALLTGEPTETGQFDNVVTFPWGDRCPETAWKLDNDWQAYWASPFDHTIKLEADMYIPRRIDWWSALEQQDVVISTAIRDWRGQTSSNRFYRKIFDDSGLPDVYNAITYFKKSPFAEKFFSVVRDIFENWCEYKNLIRCYDTEIATTDVVYAIAAVICGVDQCTLPRFTDMSMVHMKQHIAGTILQDWSRELLWEIDRDVFRIGTIPQMWPVHYHVKTFADKIIGEL